MAQRTVYIEVVIVLVLQYEYALRHLYALVNLCEGGYPTDRYCTSPKAESKMSPYIGKGFSNAFLWTWGNFFIFLL